jgi:hypothetical protein
VVATVGVGSISGSGGARKVVPTEPRSASQSSVCQRRSSFGLKVDPPFEP